MLKLFITISCVIFATCAFAQGEAKLYATTADYVQKSHTLKIVTIEKRSGGSIAMVGGSDYKIYDENDKSLSKELKKTYFLVERNDSLFVNFKYLGGNWYGITFYRNDNYIFFVGAESKLKNNAEAAVMFGAIGGLATAGAKYNYVLNLSDRSIQFVTPAVMKNIMGDSEIYARYKNEVFPYSTETLLKYLNEFYQ